MFFHRREGEREREREREDRAEARERRNQGEGPISRPTPHRGARATEKNKRRGNFSSEATINAQRRGGQGDQRPLRELRVSLPGAIVAPAYAPDLVRHSPLEGDGNFVATLGHGLCA